MANQTSQHILGTAATLLGFCLVVITTMDVTSYANTSIVDEFTSGIALSLIVACIFSFFSIRSNIEIREKRLETTADYLFIASLAGLMIVISLIVLHVIK